MNTITNKFRWQWWQIILLVFFLSWFTGANLHLAWNESPTNDEAAHIAAGYSYLTTRDFRLNAEHPPFVKELSALSLLPLKLKDVKTLNGWHAGDQWRAGEDFLYRNNTNPRKLIFLARLAPVLIALVLAVVILVATVYFTNIYGGLLALGLFCFDPNVIAHSHLVTTDIGSALGFLIVLMTGFYYANKPTYKRLLLLAFSLGLAFSIKFATLIMLAYVPIFIVLGVFYNRQCIKNNKVLVVSTIKKLVFLTILAFLTVFIFYGLEVVQPAAKSTAAGEIGQSNAIFNAIKNLHIPLFSYFRGLGRLVVHSQSVAQESVYLLGHYYSGVWFYFIVAFFIKTPLVILAAMAATALVGIKQLHKVGVNNLFKFKKVVYLLIMLSFVVAYFLISCLSSINIGWRHILPIYPFVYIFIAVAVFLFVKRFTNLRHAWLWCYLILLLPLSLTTFSHWPYLISYANEALPIVSQKTYWPRLTDSNLDWGQDVYRLIDYAEKHPSNLYKYQLFNKVDLKYLDAPVNLQKYQSHFNTTTCQLDDSHRLIIGYQTLYNDNERLVFSCLRGKAPIDTIGSSILVY